MATEEEEKYAFVVEWYDPLATLVRQYLLYYFNQDGTVEMYDVKNRRTFLRRCKPDNLRLSDIYVGCTVNILSRQLRFVDYGDEFTRKKFHISRERTLGIIKPDALLHLGTILDSVWRACLQITQMKMIRLTRLEATNFYADRQGSGGFNDMVNLISSDPFVAIEIRGEDAVKRWLELIGPEDASRARQCAPSTIRARFGTDCIRNAVHGSESEQVAAREIEFMFPTQGPLRVNSACFVDCTCGIIKPHAIVDGSAGDIIGKIIECGFEINAIMLVTLDKANVEEFLEVYKGVLQEYPLMVTELSCGPCIAMEIRAKDAVKTFREFVGPADPEIARHLRPRTLRAQYGKTKTQNALHCTDLPEDGVLEVEYFFKILDQ